MLARSSQHETVEALREQLKEKSIGSRCLFSSGLIGTLPMKFRRGAIVEYLADPGSAATVVALLTAREACREGGALVVVDRLRTFYPPAAARLGLNQDAIIVHPRSSQDELWALNQTLRCPGVAAVVSWPERLPEAAFRGLQLAAEHGGSVGLFLRSLSVRGKPSWSDTQLLVEALPGGKKRRLRIEVLRSRFGEEGVWENVEFDDETTTLKAASDVSMVSSVASSAGTFGASSA